MSRPIQTGKEARGGLAQRAEVSEVGVHELPDLNELWTIDYTPRNSFRSVKSRTGPPSLASKIWLSMILIYLNFADSHQILKQKSRDLGEVWYKESEDRDVQDKFEKINA